MGNLSEFQSVQIVGARLAGASVTKTASLLGVSRVAVSKVTMQYTTHGKTLLKTTLKGPKDGVIIIKPGLLMNGKT
jgi:hypothetical protein